jgi:hypothetical protein
VNADELIHWLASMPLSNEDMKSTWCPPDWEDISEWWDRAVLEAREIGGAK